MASQDEVRAEGRYGADPESPARGRAEEKLREFQSSASRRRWPGEAEEAVRESLLRQVELERRIDELKFIDAERHLAWSRLKELYDSSPVGSLELSPGGAILEANLTASVLLGSGRAALIGRGIDEFIHPDDRGLARLGSGSPPETIGKRVFEARFLRSGVMYFWARVEATAGGVGSAGSPVRRVVLSDVTERKRAEDASRRNEAQFKALFMSMTEGFVVSQVIYDEDGEPCDFRFLEVNPRFERLLGLERERIIGKRYRELVPEDAMGWLDAYLWVARTGTPRTDEFYSPRYALHFETYSYRPIEGQVTIIVRDITERKKAEEERAKLEAQLMQAQKMESVGRLAGGVAHDFNNMLGVIIGQADLAIAALEPGSALAQRLDEIQKAALRSADLTRQLLAFARKQTIAPVPLDLNAAVQGTLSMLKRLIGEDIELAWKPGEGLWTAMMDPGQVDQILANLCVNARDAITGVGTITIATENAELDEAYSARHGGAGPGRYVALIVSDTGCGMGKDVLDKLFEPFFTTKELGKGTGLGLATVYGIVKQNDGCINVYSEVGKGTTIKVYLPRHDGEAAERAPPEAEHATSGRGTILVVEDDSMILEMTASMLETLGYDVLRARLPSEAVALVRDRGRSVDLLLTDTIMPEMNGRDLARELSSLFPGLRCLFMSGYTADVIAHHGVLDEGTRFIQKPFTLKSLSEKVKEALSL